MKITQPGQLMNPGILLVMTFVYLLHISSESNDVRNELQWNFFNRYISNEN